MRKHLFILLAITFLIIVFSSCHAPRYYTRYRLREPDREVHEKYNPYHRKWYRHGFHNGII